MATRVVQSSVSVLVVACALSIVASLAGGCGAPRTSTSTDGGELVSSLCGRCHPIARVRSVRKGRAAWTATINRMRSLGLQVSDAQAEAIIGYLTKRDGV